MTTAKAIVEWRPTPQQQMAAQYLGIGCTWKYTAEKAMCTEMSLGRWLKQQPFLDLVEDTRRRAFEVVEPRIFQNVALALEVQRQAFTGEIPANDRRVALAEKLLDRFLGALVPVPTGTPAAGPTVPVQINNYTGPHAPVTGYIEQPE